MNAIIRILLIRQKHTACSKTHFLCPRHLCEFVPPIAMYARETDNRHTTFAESFIRGTIKWNPVGLFRIYLQDFLGFFVSKQDLNKLRGEIFDVHQTVAQSLTFQEANFCILSLARHAAIPCRHHDELAWILGGLTCFLHPNGVPAAAKVISLTIDVVTVTPSFILVMLSVAGMRFVGNKCASGRDALYQLRTMQKVPCKSMYACSKSWPFTKKNGSTEDSHCSHSGSQITTNKHFP